jgi:hypothetical protein
MDLPDAGNCRKLDRELALSANCGSSASRNVRRKADVSEDAAATGSDAT